jgi:ADP-heptose:LPS heptosyltransferase
LLVSPGARSYLKRWPADYFAELVQKICKKIEYTVVLIGDHFDVDVCTQIERSLDMDNCLNVAGKISAGQFAFLVERASLILSNDSATMHLANFYSRPVVGIFGPTDAAKYGYVSHSSRVIKPELDFATIEKMNDSDKRKEFAKITPDKVLPVIFELIGQKNP